MHAALPRATTGELGLVALLGHGVRRPEWCALGSPRPRRGEGEPSGEGAPASSDVGPCQRQASAPRRQPEQLQQPTVHIFQYRSRVKRGSIEAADAAVGRQHRPPRGAPCGRAPAALAAPGGGGRGRPSRRRHRQGCRDEKHLPEQVPQESAPGRVFACVIDAGVVGGAGGGGVALAVAAKGGIGIAANRSASFRENKRGRRRRQRTTRMHLMVACREGQWRQPYEAQPLRLAQGARGARSPSRRRRRRGRPGRLGGCGARLVRGRPWDMFARRHSC
mmetsp:Transcript_44609/g.129757  ORF Transcript_44609/g.129757 Transcript_44609/m.129757 type:complete len:277 (+) Transcript_44609:561-1391(+)